MAMTFDMKWPRRRSAFTLVEMLVAIAIIVVLAALILPVVADARDYARRSMCMSNQSHIMRLTQLYAVDHDDQLPTFFYTWTPGNSQNGLILLHTQPPWAVASGFSQYDPKLLICPSDPKPGIVSVKNEQGTVQDVTLSYGYNVDVLVQKPAYSQILAPYDLALFYDAGFSTTGNGKIQGAYHGTEDLAMSLFEPRHFDQAAVAFADGHVETHDVLTSDMILLNPAPGSSPGNSPGNGNPGNGNPGNGHH